MASSDCSRARLYQSSYTTDGFLVLKGSRGRRENTTSLQGTSGERFRQKLIEEVIMLMDGSQVVLSRDHLLFSPIMAAAALMGRTTNGWTE